MAPVSRPTPRLALGASPRWGCACGQPHAAPCALHSPSDAAVAEATAQHHRDVQQEALLRALFPQAPLRRRLLQVLGASTLRAAVAAALPVGALAGLEAQAQNANPASAAAPAVLKLGFIPITCATPLIAAHPLGLYQKQGLSVQLVKTPGWGAIRERVLKRELHASHFLAPMPLAMSLGLGSHEAPLKT